MGKQTKIARIGQLTDICPVCNEETLFTSFQVVEETIVLGVQVSRHEIKRYARCGNCRIEFPVTAPGEKPGKASTTGTGDSIRFNPSSDANAEVWFKNAERLYAQEMFEESLVSVNNALMASPRVAKYWALRAMDVYKLGYLDEAVASFDRALEIDPGAGGIRHTRDTIDAWLRKRRNGQ